MEDALQWLDDEERVEELALFLDFDGTLSPIVERPGDARPLEGIPSLIERIGAVIPVAIISGRGLDDVVERLGVPSIYYAGSHGMEIADPDGGRSEPREVAETLPKLDDVEDWLRGEFRDLPGIEIERKRFGVAVHYRRAPEERESVEKACRRAAEEFQGLKVGRGKMVREVQPDVDYHKGTALAVIRERIDDSEKRPIYIGDDVTDEDAFQAVADEGVGVLVSPQSRESAAILRLDDPAAVSDFLKRLAERLEEA